MQVTNIRMSLLENAGGCKAIGSISLDNEFAVRGMRVMEDHKGRSFVAFPSRPRANGEYEDIAFPLSKEFYHEITDAFMKEFNRMKEEAMKEGKNEEADKDAFIDIDKALGTEQGESIDKGSETKAAEEAAQEAAEEAAKPRRGRSR